MKRFSQTIDNTRGDTYVIADVTYFEPIHIQNIGTGTGTATISWSNDLVTWTELEFLVTDYDVTQSVVLLNPIYRNYKIEVSNTGSGESRFIVSQAEKNFIAYDCIVVRQLANNEPDSLDVKKYIEINSTYTALLDDEIINCTSGTFNLTLYTSLPEGREVDIRNSGSGNITLVGSIQGESSFILYPEESVILISSGTNYKLWD